MRASIKSLILAGVVIALLLSSGCKQYKVVVSLNRDGTGTRTIEMRGSTIGEDDFEIELDEFRKLFGLDEKRGWKMKREVKTPTDELEMAIFTLDRKAKHISSWQAMSGDIDVRGTLEKGPLEDIAFYNEIEVERSEGNIITYRETLTWKNLKEKAVDMNAAFFTERLAEVYSFLSKDDRDDIRSFLAGMITVSWYAEEVAEEKMEDELYTQAARDYIAYRIKEKYPDRDMSGLGEVLDRIMKKEGEEYLDRILKEKLPGVYLAGHTSITFTVTMPGKIVDSNATSVEGNTAVWKYDLMLAPLNHPVELFVRSEISQ
jgi:hypothetical protein